MGNRKSKTPKRSVNRRWNLSDAPAVRYRQQQQRWPIAFGERLRRPSNLCNLQRCHNAQTKFSRREVSPVTVTEKSVEELSSLLNLMHAFYQRFPFSSNSLFPTTTFFQSDQLLRRRARTWTERIMERPQHTLSTKLSTYTRDTIDISVCILTALFEWRTRYEDSRI